MRKYNTMTFILLGGLILLVVLMVHTSKLLHYIEPKMEIVQDDNYLSSYDVEKLGKLLAPKRDYFWRYTYKKTTKTAGLFLDIKRDTLSKELFYVESK